MLAYDVAICLNAWCFESDLFVNVTKARALLNAYGRERKLSEAEENALPLLARGAALRFLLTRLVDFLNVPKGALVRPKDPLNMFRKLSLSAGLASIAIRGVAASGASVRDYASHRQSFIPMAPARAIPGPAAGAPDPGNSARSKGN